MFSITDEQKQLIDKFSEEQDALWDHRQYGEAYYGAIGGSLTYHFTPTGIGTSLIVEHASGNKLDVSDYDNW